jgi:phosphoglycerate dehydrogenase-like enzyme
VLIMTAPRVAVGPAHTAFTESAEKAVRNGGGELAEADARADALVWLNPGDIDGLRAALSAASNARWVQLPFAGVERVAASGLFDPARTWTSAKGAYAEPVAEHALALALAGLRLLPERITARSWGPPGGTSLYDQPVTILGGGGITARLLELLAPLRVTATVVRRHPDPFPGAARTVGQADLHQALAGAQVVFLALALTPETTGIIGAGELAAMRPGAWLVNVARGGHVDTAALVAALTAGTIGGAALDVTDPEPLPDGHPLWQLENCIITPHTADTTEMIVPLLARRIEENVIRFAAGEPLVGVVDPSLGY